MSELTGEQQSAVEARGSVIVSAAAGSGKTFVMIERLVSLVLGGTDVKSILAVTFTNKAAAQMRDRLRKALLKGIGERTGEERERLKAQLKALPLAEISTIHAFCARLVRTYFYAVGADPAFRVTDPSDAVCSELSARAMETVFEAAYERDDQDLRLLLSAYFRKKKDDALRAIVKDLYAAVRGVADYRKILASFGAEDLFRKACADLYASFCGRLCEIGKGLSARREVYAALGEKALSAAEGLSSACDALKNAGGLFAMREAAASLPPLPRTPSKRSPSAEEKGALAFLSGARKELKAVAEELISFAAEEEEHARCLSADRLAAALGKFALAYDEAYTAEKREAGVLDYNDLEQFALQILEGDLGAEIRAKYAAVFVDEYQDVNPVQDRILTAIGGKEVFFVGDAKQAIYGFRGSNSEFFEEKARSLPASLLLTANFRSAPAVLEAVNRVFTALSPDYVPMRGGERYGAHTGEVQFHLVEKDRRETAPPEGVYSVLEHTGRARRDALAEEVARIVERERGSGTWYDADEPDGKKREKRVRYGDIAVLTRRRAGEAEGIVRALGERGIPVSAAAEVNICDFFEARLILDWLSYLDNPEQDIPLVTAMLSAAGGFTEEELTKVRAAFPERKKESFRALLKDYLAAHKDGISEKAAAFFALSETLRAHMRVRTAEEIVGELLSLGLEAQIAAKEGGGSRLARVRRLAAEGAETDVHTFLSRLRATGFSLGFSEGGGEDAVRVVTMHASKGLEYPVVILAGTDVRFRGDDRAEVLFTERYLAAPKAYDAEKKLVYGTVLRRAAALSGLEKERAQERNLLYVGMTRAKYRLHVMVKEGTGGALTPAFAKCFADFFDFPALADLFVAEEPAAQSPVSRRALAGEADPALVARILEVYNRPYAFEQSVSLPVKSSATALMEAAASAHARGKSGGAGAPEAAPAFNGFTPAPAELTPAEDIAASREEGVAYHAFLQHVRFGQSAAEELARMRRENILPPAQAALLRESQLGKILALPCFAGISRKKIWREQTFLVGLQADELLPTDAADTVIFQGAIDLLCEDEEGYLIIDYKYSSLGDEALRKKYAVQLLLYRKAVARVMKIDERTVRARIVNIARCREIEL